MVKLTKKIELTLVLTEQDAIKLYNDINPIPLPAGEKVTPSKVKELIAASLGYHPTANDEIPF